jgi:protein-disulfide isomerase
VAKKEGARVRPGEPAGPLKAFWVSSPAYWSVAALLGAAIVLSAFLISKHFGGGLPGCGPTSGCEALEKTAWGMVPGIRWPVSFLGFAYFFALLAAWMVTDRELPAVARWLLRTGGAASLLFIGVMVFYRKVCPYCVGVHAVNLGVLLLIERETRRTARLSRTGGESMTWVVMRKIAGTALGAFLVVSLVLGVANARLQEKGRVNAEADRQASTEKILAQAQSQTESQAQALAQATSGQTPGSGASGDAWGKNGFTGRYRLGPEASPIRIVMLTDYQCVDCQRVEGEIEEILASRNDISLSIKHYPFCAEAAPGVPCNKYVKQTLHANACWAARAAEAAGILKGDKGFFEMHRWLFGRKGTFTDADLQAGLVQMGYEPGSFLAVMKGDETLRRVQSDCEEGGTLGLYFTPMVFVNGVEFKGWQVPGALRRTIEEVAAKNPPPLTSSADRPALASLKDVQDWRDQPVRAIPADTRSWSTGAANAGAVPAGSKFVDVIMFGDYQEPYTAAMDIAIRDLMKTRPNVRYTFRHFPIDPKVNPTLPPNVRPEAVHPLAGRAAQAAEAAGNLGGAKAYWKMHDWLMRNVKSFSDESLRAAASKMGLDPAALFAEMSKPAVNAPIVEDSRAAQQLGLNAVPMVFVNGKWVLRTLREQENVVLRVIDAAGRP